MKKYSVMIGLLLLIGSGMWSCSDSGEEPVVEIPDDPDEEEDNIRLKAKFDIGAAVTNRELSGAQYANTLRTHYSQITAEFEMKMAHIWKGENNYDWAAADEMVNFAQTNNMKVHGHTLVWYSSFPNWFKSANYDSAAFESRVKTYIERVVQRYKGKVVSWDVANEIFNDNGTLRSENCPVYQTFRDPIAFYGRCFAYARAIDPDAKLFYNDYNVVLASGKRGAMRQMVNRFQADGYPIDGLGDQFHYMVSTNRNTIRNGLTDMAGSGLLIHISELDIRVNVNREDDYVYLPSEQAKHAEAYRDIVSFYESIPQNQKFAITTWGVADNGTWLRDWWHPKEYPLLFDDSFQKKRAYEGFLEGLN
ncbi:endo-1,4-beta-xylanase [Belliella kenyensis]|uniref:Beta-xylanase n=1 Tax=Belliella kenyensis TaxID=1472724 RepID=A0ABV8EN65_9BACT|nr:endo-1,4-beta-xylanase [Belliella kenyensis]MCH7403362.1 endo-1,4-beta-xylanase [Belliella kenyensis]MDN3601574.1 endo-1,4-beta-xylanase [Belliella kenyensis]